jgi:hypothetical protein
MKTSIRIALAFAALAAFGAVMACSPGGEPDESSRTSEEALTAAPDDDPPPTVRVTLASFDPVTGAISGTVNGAAFSSTVASSTIVRLAPLNLWPVDPIRPLAVRWNALITAIGSPPVTFGETSPTNPDATFAGLLGQMAAAGAHFRAKLDASGAVFALRPVP